MEKKKTIRLRKNDIELLAALKAYLETLPEPIPTIEELSKIFGINTDKLKKGFKEMYGIAPYHYVLQLKLERAKRLLRETELPMTDIAIQLGYEYAGNFSAWFKGIIGVTPLQWRFGTTNRIDIH